MLRSGSLERERQPWGPLASASPVSSPLKALLGNIHEQVTEHLRCTKILLRQFGYLILRMES
jgi:hypothetical protein